MSAPRHDGPFFHGTVAALQPGDLLIPGRPSNYRPDVVMNHIDVTALRDGAGLAAELASELAAPRSSSVTVERTADCLQAVA